MMKYDIYSEGYACTEQLGGATYLGSAEGKNFRYACLA